MAKKRRQTKTVETQSLTDIIKKYGLLNDPKILKAVNLSYDIVQGCKVTVDKNQKILTIEHIVPKEKERNLILSMKDSQVAVTKENMPYAVVGNFLYQICLPIYYHVAKANNWRSSWVDRHIKPSRGDYWKKDTTIKVIAHPMSGKEIKDYIFKEIRDWYIAVKTKKAKDIRGTALKLLTETAAKEKEFKAQLISDLKKQELIDNSLKVLCTQAQFKKEVKHIAIKLSDPKGNIVRECPRCGKTFSVISKHNMVFCKDPCRSSAHTEAKRRIKKHLRSLGIEMKNIQMRYSTEEKGFIVQVKVPSKKAELSYIIDLSGKIREKKVE
jgi:uncharacterized C2H2 Zn-finger protein